MLKIATFLFWALTAWSLWQESVALDFESEYPVCLLDDPNPNDDSLCLKDLRPLLIETNAKLDGLEGEQVKMEGRLEAKVKDQLQIVQTKVEEVESKLQAAMTKIGTQLQSIIDKINANQITIAKNHEHQRLVKIGERYFRFFEYKQNWCSASKTCERMLGQIASFISDKEVGAVKAELKELRGYWQGSDNLDDKGQLVPLEETPLVVPHVKKNKIKKNCIALYKHGAKQLPCTEHHFFICQLGY